MVGKTLKSKYRLGQKVWFIDNGYVRFSEITAVFIDKYDTVMCGFTGLRFETTFTMNVGSSSKYYISDDQCVEEAHVYPTREALIKSIKDIKFDE